MRLGVVASLAAIALVARMREASACQRPTDPGGVNGYDYGSAPVAHFDGASVRVWYTTTGPHAVNPATTRSDQVPDNVATAASVGDSSLAAYAQMGFAQPISDKGSGTDCGGTPALDIYLMHFNAADGDTAPEGCQQAGKATKCWSFGQVESRLEVGYGSFELGAHVVVAHELFHSVQDAYDQGLDRFWAEGTAQWGAKAIYPAETDFEANLPAFFEDATESIDLGGGSVVGSFLYGSAIWPQYLSERFGKDAVRGAFEQEGNLGPPSMHAIDAALPAFGSSLADAFPTFAAWNAATGARAGTGGYANAKSYPQVALQAFSASGSASGIVTGYSVFFYSYDFGDTAQQLVLAGDSTRVGARAFPLTGGKAQLDRIATLPATVTGAGVLVVAGVSSKKNDAPFTVTAGPPPSETPDAGDDSPASGSTKNTGGSGGCAIAGDPSASAWTITLAVGALVAARRRRR